MSKTYRIREGDTLDLISRINYGIPDYVEKIKSANPELVDDGLVVGSVINIPDVQVDQVLGVPLKREPADQDAVDIDEFGISIEGKPFQFFENASIRKSIDIISSFGFSAPFDPDEKAMRDLFVPFSFKPCVMSIGGVPQINGTLVNVDPQEGNNITVALSGYGIAGVLNDANMPVNSFPIEFFNQKLDGIARQCLQPFGLSFEFLDDIGPTFDSAKMEANTKVLTFLAGLANQRNLLIRDDVNGKLIFKKANEIGNPVARLEGNSTPVVSIKPKFQPQNYYSDVSGISPMDFGADGGKYTEKNTLMPGGVIRPFTYKPNDTTGGSLKAAVQTKAGQMIGNAMSWEVVVDTLRDPKGNLWEPDTTVIVNAPNAMIYKDTELVIRTIDLQKGAEKSAVLSCVLPGAFSGKIPETLPWLD